MNTISKFKKQITLFDNTLTRFQSKSGTSETTDIDIKIYNLKDMLRELQNSLKPVEHTITQKQLLVVNTDKNMSWTVSVLNTPEGRLLIDSVKKEFNPKFPQLKMTLKGRHSDRKKMRRDIKLNNEYYRTNEVPLKYADRFSIYVYSKNYGDNSHTLINQAENFVVNEFVNKLKNI